MKNGSVLFMTLEDLMIYVVNKSGKLFDNGSFIKISVVEDDE